MASLYKLDWRNKHLTADAKSVGEMADALDVAAKQLREMAAGVTLDLDSPMGEDYAALSTTDPNVAKRFGMGAEAVRKKESTFTRKPGFMRKGAFGRK